jgi:hypothetical protein
MRVRIERRGGFVGRMAAGERDIDKLDPVQRRELDRIVQRPPEPTPSPGADRFMYTIVVKNDDGSNRVVIRVPEDKMPDALASIPQIEL